MRRIFAIVAVLAAALLAVFQLRLVIAADSPAPVQPAPSRPAPDSLTAARDSLMNEVLRSIAGRESAPAESVFKDIRALKGMPAGRLPRVMNIAFSQSLGVGCDHCHTVGEWEKEDKRPKQVARDMWALMGTINREMLPKIPNLESKQPTVNCTTCHRGAVKPAVSLERR